MQPYNDTGVDSFNNASCTGANDTYVFSDVDSAVAAVCAGATAILGTVLNGITVIALLNYNKTRCVHSKIITL